MAELKERDAMICRSCNREERASEGYPCANCGTFICVMCNLRGIVLCKDCRDQGTSDDDAGVDRAG